MARDSRARAPRARRPRALRSIVLLAALATLAGLLGLTSAAAGAKAASSSSPAVSAAHPYSNPVWLPLHSGFGVDCAGRNPGCSSYRGFFSIDMVPTGQFGPHAHKSYADVYSMGAGIVHVGEAHGTRCGSTSVGSFGTWVWVDHGAGVVSRYGHLSRILVKNGAHVAAGTPIGVVGTTGKAKNCGVSYLDFMVEHHGLANNNSYHFNTLKACSGGLTRTWPGDAATTKKPGNDTRVHFTVWDHVPHGTQFPASSGSCIPGGVPATTAGPSGVKVTKTASRELTVRWATPAAGTRQVVVELSVYHPSTGQWAKAHNEVWRSASPSAGHVTVGGLMPKHLYRARVSLMGSVGASRSSSWVQHRD